jgi:hypothetical protein
MNEIYEAEIIADAEGADAPIIDVSGTDDTFPSYVESDAAEGTKSPTDDAAAKGGAVPSPGDKIAAAGARGVYVHRFKKPFEYEGRKYETINFYFERLTGDDMLAIETEMQDNNEYAIAPEISRKFQCMMASKAGHVGSDVLRKLPLPEFNKITNEARRFLIDTGY